MSVWLCIPARRDVPESTIVAWADAGYKVAIARETLVSTDPVLWESVDIMIRLGGEYPGWSVCSNALIHAVMLEDPNANWFVAGGDDTLPDPKKTPDEIATECEAWFGARPDSRGMTFGVMQPTGDDWSDSKGKTIERIAGSPWIGREFARRMYHGGGPLYAGFSYSFADEHLQNVAQKLGVFWQRPDLTHEHRHIARNNPNWQAEQPEWTKKLYERGQWDRNQALFNRLKAGGFKEAYDLLD